MEKKAMDLLQAFARDTKREITIDEAQGQIVTIKDQDDVYFIACDRELIGGFRSFFSGVFTTAPEPCPSRMDIVRKGFLDHLSFRTGYQAVKTGDPAFDKKTRVTSNNPPMALRLLAGPEARNIAEEALSFKPGTTISINEIVSDAVPAISNQSQLSIYVPKDWITGADELNRLFDLTIRLRKAFYPED